VAAIVATSLAAPKLARAAALLTLACFLYHTILPAWSQPSSDFPNYYTAAKLARTSRPLHLYYDWTWFQRQIHYAGIDGQLGGYIPQTPLTLVPFIPLGQLAAPRARQIWLLLNCAFLAISLRLLSRITRLNIAWLWLIAFLAGDALSNNFRLGQYYVFLLALLAGGAYCLITRRDRSAGAWLGLAFVLKLYGGPLFLLLLAKRRWRSGAAFGAVCALSACLCIAWFGAGEVSRYATHILPGSLEGDTLNPFHPSNNTASTLLRRDFVKEDELNPHPVADFPFLFFLCRNAFVLAVMVFTAMGTIRSPDISPKKILAWWLVAILLLSPNTASYTFVLLLLPVALLFDEMPRARWFMVLTAFALLCLPLRPSWSWLFPRLWLMLALFFLIGHRALIAIPRRWSLAAASIIGVAAAAAGAVGANSVTQAPTAHFARVVTEPGAIYSGSPAIAGQSLLYETIRSGHYAIRRNDRTFEFPGEAFHPTAPDSGTLIYFESVLGTDSKIMRFDSASGDLTAMPLGVAHPEQPAPSRDGRLLAFIADGRLYCFDGIRSQSISITGEATNISFAPGDAALVVSSAYQRRYYISLSGITGQHASVLLASSSDLASPSLSSDGRTLLYSALTGSGWQVRIKSLPAGAEREITHGHCNNVSPVWSSGRRQILFASDCGRGIGLPSLYITPPLDNLGNFVPESLDSEAGIPLAPAIR